VVAPICTYDADKNVTGETTGGVMASYTWTAGQDAEDRLIDWDSNTGEERDWDLSLVGDWDEFTRDEDGQQGPLLPIVQPRNHTDAHEVDDIDGTPADHDPKGNMTNDGAVAGNARTFAWDFDNRLTTATMPDGRVHTYTYDALGRRVSKNIDNGVMGGGSKTVSDTVFSVSTSIPLALLLFLAGILIAGCCDGDMVPPDTPKAFKVYWFEFDGGEKKLAFHQPVISAGSTDEITAITIQYPVNDAEMIVEVAGQWRLGMEELNAFRQFGEDENFTQTADGAIVIRGGPGASSRIEKFGGRAYISIALGEDGRGVRVIVSKPMTTFTLPLSVSEMEAVLGQADYVQEVERTP